MEFQNHYGAFLVSSISPTCNGLDLGPAQPIDLAVRDLFGAAS